MIFFVFIKERIEGGVNMLGVNLEHKPISGKFAREIRAKVARIQSGRLTSADKKEIRANRTERKIVVKWK